MIYKFAHRRRRKGKNRQCFFFLWKKGVNVVHWIVNSQTFFYNTNNMLWNQNTTALDEYRPKIFVIASGCTTFILVEPFHLTTYSILVPQTHGCSRMSDIIFGPLYSMPFKIYQKNISTSIAMRKIDFHVFSFVAL